MLRALPGLLALGLIAACSSSSTGGGATAADAGTSDTDADITDAGVGTGTMCTSARSQLLAPVAKVSKGEVTIVSITGATKHLYVDASAGGFNGEATNPRIYVNLETATRVDLTDTQAFTSTAWDLALKRTVLYSNSGDAGLGVGGAAQVTKAFASVTAADVPATIKPEAFFDADCNPKVDAIGNPQSVFSDWYNYDQATNIPTPNKSFTYVVKGGTGKLYKVAITSYTGLPDGGVGPSTGYFLLDVAPL